MSDGFDEPRVSRTLRRPLAAVWISLGLHGALIALVQISPSTGPTPATSVIEARLVAPHTAAATPRAAPAPVRAPKVTQPPAPVSRAEDAKTPRVPTDPPASVPSAQLPLPAQPPSPVPAPPETPGLAAASLGAPENPAPAPITSAVDLTYYSARELDVPPRPLRKVEPDYPPKAEARRVSGKVTLRLRIEVDGRVSKVDIEDVEPAGYYFEDYARAAVAAARFAPARKNGRAVRSEFLFSIVFGDRER